MDGNKNNTCYLIGEASLLIKCGDILLNNGFLIKGVISNEPKICQWAQKNSLQVLSSDKSYIETLKNDPFDYLFSIVNYKIMKKEVLDLPKKMAINFHDAILPSYGGIHATSWAILNDEKDHGITWHVMEEGIDTGNILKQKHVTIDRNDTAFSLNLKCYTSAIEGFEELIEEIVSDAVVQEPQNLTKRTYFDKNKRIENGGIIQWPNNAETIDRLIRAFDFGEQDNRLGKAKLYIDGAYYIILSSRILNNDSTSKAGTILKLANHEMTISTTSKDIVLKLADLKGAPIDLNHIITIKEGGQLRNPDAVTLTKLAALYEESARSEHYWEEKLLNLNDPIIQHILRLEESNDYKQTEHSLDLSDSFLKYVDKLDQGLTKEDYMFLGLCGFIARVGESQSFDIGFAHKEYLLEIQNLENVYEKYKPLHIHVEAQDTFDILCKKTIKEVNNVKTKKGYNYEIFSRLLKLSQASKKGNDFCMPFVIEQSESTMNADLFNDMTFKINLEQGNVKIIFNSNKFDEEKTIALMNRINVFLEGIAKKPKTPIMKTNILTDYEYNRIIHDFNQSDYEYPKEKCTYELIEEQVQKTPDNIAVRYEDRSITYAELDRKANQLANYIKSIGIEENQLIGVFHERSIEMMIALIGIWKAGCAYVPLDPMYPKDRLMHMIEEAKMPLIISQSDLADKLPSADIEVLKMDSDKEKIFNDALSLTIPTKRKGKPLSTKNRRAYVIFTSGSTGKPKGVVITQRNLTNYLWFVVENQRFTEKDKFMALTTICFDISLCELFANLIRGGEVEILPTVMQRDPYLLMEKIENTSATAIQATPATWDMLVSVGWDKKLPLKLYCGGEAMSPELAGKLIPRCDELWNIYGPSEATIWSSISHIMTTDITIGHPVYNAQYYVLDQFLNPVPEGMSGELYIGGDGLALGYLNREDLTQERFLQNPFDKKKSEKIYKTGDFVRFLPDGNVEWLGRIDNQVKLRGFRIELEEIETLLKQQDEIENAIVALREDKAGFKGLYAFIIPDKKSTLNCNIRFDEKLKNVLPGYMVPGHYIVLDSFPLTMNKKVDRKSLGLMSLEEIKSKHASTVQEVTSVVHTEDQSSPLPKTETQKIENEAVVQESNIPINHEHLLNFLIKELIYIAAKVLKTDCSELDSVTPLGEYGYDSVSFTVLSIKIKEHFKIGISPALFYSYASIEQLVEYIANKYYDTVLGKYLESNPQEESKLSIKTIPSEDDHKTYSDTDVESAANLNDEDSIVYYKNGKKEPVAVIGIAGILPMSPSLNEFWDNLVNQKDMISHVPKDRWNPDDYFGEDAKAGSSNNPVRAGFIDDVDKFDAGFFNISPREAQLMDPQQRLFIETVWKTIEDAGYKASTLSNNNIGVYVGVVATDYWDLMSTSPELMDTFSTSGRINCVIANRISYMLNLRGPSATIDTACSSSLIAIHRAVTAIQDGYCDGAIAGGVNVMANPYFHVAIGKKGMLSADGRCKTFDKDADGYVRAEGVGAIFLKPLSKALKDGDHIYGVIKSSVENHGGRSNSFTAPNAQAQTELIVEAYKKADFSPDTITYIETHGTGTSLGDPIEINAINSAIKILEKDSNITNPKKSYLGVGSVKTNIGHLEAGAGVAGVLKVLLSLKNGILPGNINFNHLNPYINLEDSPVYLVNQTEKWERLSDNDGNLIPRRAGVSSFGFGGSNAHVTFEEFTVSCATESNPGNNTSLIVLSAKNEGRLKAYANEMHKFITSHCKNATVSLADFAYTLQVGREEMEERMAIIADSFEALDTTLKEYIEGKSNIENLYTNNVKGSKKKLDLLMEGEEGEAFIKSIIQNKKLPKLAQLWIIGVEINWNSIYTDKKPKKMSLPTYPFEKIRHWLPDSYKKSNSGVKVLHPLIDLNESTLEAQVYKKTINKYDAVIKDHISNGQTIFPGAAYLEMARAAGQLAFKNSKVIKLQNNVWAKALMLQDKDTDLSISLMSNNQGIQYKIQSEDAKANNLHSQGSIVYGESNINKEVLDIAMIKSQMLGSYSKQECYEMFADAGFEYGPSYQSIKQLYYHSSAAYTEIERPSEFNGESDDFVLNPVLLDGALQSIILFVGNSYQETGRIYMPFAMGELEIFGKLPEKCSAYSMLTEDKNENNYSIKKFAIIITDETGNILVKIKDFSLRSFFSDTPTSKSEQKSIESSSNNTPVMKYMKESWELSKLSAENIDMREIGNTLVFDCDGELYNALLANQGQDINNLISVKKGNDFNKVNQNTYEVNFEKQEDFINLFKELKAEDRVPDCILYFVTQGTYSEEKEIIIEQLNNSLFSALYMSKALFEIRPENKIKIIFAFNDENKGISPIYTAIKGYLKGLETENTKIAFKTIEFKGLEFDAFSEICLNEFSEQLPWKHKAIKYNDTSRLINSFIDTGMASEIDLNELPLTQEGVYIITGGAGKVGLMFGKYLAKKVKAKLIIAEKAMLNESIASEIREIEKLGSEVVYQNIDISTEREVSSLIKGTRRKFGKINGILHCAGIIRDAFIQNKTKEEAEAVINTKVKGTIWLDKYTKEDHLDFFAMWSSISAVLGNIGQSDYAYANCFMDEFSKIRDLRCKEGSRFGKSIAIGWPLWKEGGMRIDPSTEKFLLNTYGIQSLETDEGLKAFEYAISQESSHLLVLKGNDAKLSEVFGGVRADISKPKFMPIKCTEICQDAIPIIIQPGNVIPASTVETAYNPKERKSASFETDVLNDLIIMTSEIQKINLSDIEASGDISEYGFDSIGFTEFSNKINEKYNLAIMPSVFFEHSTLTSLGNYLMKEFTTEIEGVYNHAEIEPVKVMPLRTMPIPQANTILKVKPLPKNEDSIFENVVNDLIRFTSKIQKLNINDVDSEADMSEFGFDSIGITEFCNEINENLNISIMPSVFFEHATISSLARYLVKEFEHEMNEKYNNNDAENILETLDIVPKFRIMQPQNDATVNSLENTVLDVHKSQINGKHLQPEALNKNTDRVFIKEPVAIIGISGVMPQSENLDTFWENIEAGKDLITEIPKDRWDWEAYYGDPVSEPNKTNVKYGGFMKEIDHFDPLFFGISPKEAALMDPQQRILLENVWKSMEDGGIKPSSISGSRTGVFLGAGAWDYLYELKENDIDIQAQTSSGIAFSILANRISYLLNIHGPSETIDTACSSSLVAIHRAVEQIQLGNCDMAFAGGINVMLNPAIFISLSKAGMLCEDGRCKTFDKAANGYVRGEGCGVLLLKPLKKAIEDKNNIYAVIKGSAINHGGHANSLTTPNPLAQAEIISSAWSEAQVDPNTITYIETHGTGTGLGDPIEINGLKKAFDDLFEKQKVDKKATSFCGLGAVKTNIGHLEWGAGVAGVLKVLLSMKNKKLPETLHFKEQNPYIKLENSPFYIVDRPQEWKSLVDENNQPIPRRAGVSSFGFGGVNAHIALEEYISDEIGEEKPRKNAQEDALLVFSARRKDGLSQIVENMIGFIDSHSVPSNETEEKNFEANARLSYKLKEILAVILNVRQEDISSKEDLKDLGLDLVGFNQLIDKISEDLGIQLKISEITNLDTIENVSAFIIRNHSMALNKILDTDSIKSIHADISSVDKKHTVSLESIAYSSRNSKEEMDYRLAIIASSVKDLRDKLTDFILNKENNTAIFVGDIRTDKNKIQEVLDRNPDVTRHPEKLYLTDIARLWVYGYEIELDQYFKDDIKSKLRLPLYPFEKLRFSLKDIKAEKTVNEIGYTKLHPLVDRNVSNLYEQKFMTTLNNKAFYLRDHVVENSNILPGVAYLEMVRAAGEFSTLGKVSKISDVIWTMPAVVTDVPEDIYIRFNPNGTFIEFEVGSENESNSNYAQGKIHIEANIENPRLEYLDMDMLAANCKDKISKETCYSAFKKRGFNYGESFQPIEEILSGENEAIGTLVLPSSIQNSFNDFYLHPSLMDGALQTIMGIKNSDIDHEERLLPFSVGEIELIYPLEQKVKVYAKLADSMGNTKSVIKKFSITIADKNGKVLVKINDFIMRKSVSKTAEDEKVHYYQTEWSKQPINHTSKTNSIKGNLLIFDHDSRLFDSISQNPSDLNASIILVRPGLEYSKNSSTVFEITPNKIEDYVKLFESLKDMGQLPDVILHNWSKGELNTDMIREGLNISVISIFNLCKSFLEVKAGKKVRLLYLYEDGNFKNLPVFESVCGLTQTIHNENPDITVQTIGHTPDSDLMQIIADEINSDFNDAQVRYRQSLRSAKSIEKISIINQGSYEPNIREDGVYLISGGAGNLGFIFAEYIARKLRSKIILTGRSELNSQKSDNLNALKALGSEVTYIPCDISNKEQAETLIKTIKNTYGQINGVIHAAGVIKDAYLYHKTIEEFEAVIKPKLYGSIWLDELTKNEALDFFVMFSSVSGIIGNPGQSDYAYANTFLDQYANYREVLRQNKQRSGITLTINWPLWEKGGMGMDETSIKLLEKEYGFLPISNIDGLSAFEYGLSSGLPNMIVVKGNADYLKNNFEKTVNTPSHYSLKSEDIIVTDHPAESGDYMAIIEEELLNILSEEINLPASRISVHEPFEKYGIDSIMIISLNKVLENKFGKISKTLFFEYKNIKELANYFNDHFKDHFIKPNTLNNTDIKISHETIDKTQGTYRIIKNEIPSNHNYYKEGDIAIIGISGKYPMANNLDEFWENLKSGKDCITEIPKDRWNNDLYFDGDKNAKGKTYGKWGGFIEDVDKFDPMFFNISPKEAEFMDPQERLFLETAWHTLEDSGYTRNSLNQEKVGVFVGVMYNQYPLFAAEESLKGNPVAVNSTYASVANRVSYYLNLSGPSIALDTMCSSSITAIHLACESIKRGECSYAIAGGVNTSIHPNKYILLSQGRFMSSDGRCKSFGEGGDGYVPGEGVGAVLLKSLNQAIADGDRIYSVIKGSSLNHGGKTNGYSVPNPNAQGDLIIDALNRSHVDPRTITYLEAHGTGTSLGDPIELTGLSKSFGKFTDEKQFCSIGSVKSNIGHLESAAGIAAISKVVLQMQHKLLVPSLHSSTINPNIDFETSPFYIQHELESWKSITIDGKKLPRRAGISSFGAGGSNAHIILEEFDQPKRNNENTKPQLILISGKDEEGLKRYIHDIIAFIDHKATQENLSFTDFAYTLQFGRESLEERIAIIADSFKDLRIKLNRAISDEINTVDIFKGSYNIRKGNGSILLNANALFDAGKLSEIALAWLQGDEIDWQAIYHNNKPNIITIPVYPFAKESYWLEKSDQRTITALNNTVTQLHPLVQRNTSTLREQKFTTVFGGNEKCFTDHVVDGKKILPGAAYLEMAKISGDLSEENKVVKIKDILWIKPLINDDREQEIDIRLHPEEDHVAYVVSEKFFDQKETIFSKGKLYYENEVGEALSNSIYNLEKLKRRFNSMLNKEDCYIEFNEMGIAYGETFKVIEELYTGEKEALAHLKAPVNTNEGEIKPFLNLSILDGCFQAALGVGYDGRKNDALFLPYSIDELVIYERISDEVYAYVELLDDTSSAKNSKTFNVSLLNMEGKLLAKLSGFQARVFGMNGTIGKEKTDDAKVMALLNKLYSGETDISDITDRIGVYIND